MNHVKTFVSVAILLAFATSCASAPEVEEVLPLMKKTAKAELALCKPRQRRRKPKAGTFDQAFVDKLTRLSKMDRDVLFTGSILYNPIIFDFKYLRHFFETPSGWIVSFNEGGEFFDAGKQGTFLIDKKEDTVRILSTAPATKIENTARGYVIGIDAWYRYNRDAILVLDHTITAEKYRDGKVLSYPLPAPPEVFHVAENGIYVGTIMGPVVITNQGLVVYDGKAYRPNYFGAKVPVRHILNPAYIFEKDGAIVIGNRLRQVFKIKGSVGFKQMEFYRVYENLPESFESIKVPGKILRCK